MTEDWGRSALVLAVLLGAAAGLGGFALAYAEGTAYLGDDPRACANCHIMTEQFEGWQKGPHHARQAQLRAAALGRASGRPGAQASRAGRVPM